ncbi:PAS/PAC sensor signal transduction histidine kinase [Paenibacillus curdlanolyticus YK9]|uniref:histidine kinase n=1 Tax=Paenibacillus curdlanolyticus YK9 TaxID=717606 RepID=E0I5H0_9BACL|nr:PAS domain-containing sensor histidine kinase [Paenibacillus curdlanolyticus]EFM12212.1 PAS/PAC sensor signal transduction histidine kinase [Paenibacillus curdlanolyticus YK9]
MNKDATPPHRNVIAEHVETLLSQLDDRIENLPFRTALRQSLKQLADVKFALDESSIVAMTDHKGKIQYVNDKFCEISQYGREELLGKDHRIINSGYHGKSFMDEMWKTILSGKVWSGDIKNKAKDGSYYWVNTTIVPFISEEGTPYQYLAIRNEVTRLKQVEEELQAMLAKVMTIQEDERRKFSRELHDGIGQSLFSLLIQLDRVIAAPSQMNEDLSGIRHHVAGIIEEVRGLAWELRPSVLDDLGIVPAIRTYIDNFSSHYGIRVAFHCNLHKRLGLQSETVIYRIIQEALTNIAKHADVSEAEVSIHEHEFEVVVQVVDRGNGFDLTARTQGVGRFSMNERARIAGGSLALESARGQGTAVTLTIPKT